MTSRPEQPFGVLVVCTGNICRSPQAARLLQAELAARLPAHLLAALDVRSAGTRAVIGHPMDSSAADALRDLGVDPDPDHCATQLSPAALHAAGLVLAATRAHRAAVVGLDPAVVRRTFTLRELARIAPHVELPATPETPETPTTPDAASPASALTAAVGAAGALRGMYPPEHPGADDIGDPFLAPPAEHARVARDIAAAVRPIAHLLAAAVARAGVAS